MDINGKLTKEQVLHVAKLARLEIGEDEVEKFREDLSAVLTFVEKLQEVSVDGIESTSHVGGLQNVMREDSREDVNKGAETERADNMRKQFPAQAKRFLKVRALFSRLKSSS